MQRNEHPTTSRRPRNPKPERLPRNTRGDFIPRQPLIQAGLSLADAVRQLFGFRRGIEPERYKLPQAPDEPLPEEEPGALLRARPYIAARVAFAAIVWLVTMLFGVFTRTMSPDAAAAAGNLVLKSGQALTRGDTPKARELFAQAKRQAPRAPSLFFLEGHLIAAEGGAEAERLKALADDATSQRRNLPTRLRIAGYRQAKGDTEGCLADLAKAVETAPGKAELHYLMASNLLLAGKAAEALPEIQAFADLDGSPASVAELRGKAYSALGKYQEACREYEAVLGYGSPSPETRVSYAEALTNLGRHNDAYFQLALAQGADPDTPDVYFTLGLVLDSLNQTAKSEAAYREAIRRNPNSTEALNNLAYLLADRRGKPREGLEYALRADRVSPDSPPILDTIAHIHQLLAEDSKALPLLERARRLDPADSFVKLHLALAYHRAGRKADARKLLDDLFATTTNERLVQQAKELQRKL